MHRSQAISRGNERRSVWERDQISVGTSQVCSTRKLWERIIWRICDCVRRRRLALWMLLVCSTIVCSEMCFMRLSLVSQHVASFPGVCARGRDTHIRRATRLHSMSIVSLVPSRTREKYVWQNLCIILGLMTYYDVIFVVRE